MARKTTAKKKTKSPVRALSRRGNAARIVEEKHVGYETTDWENVQDFELAFRDTLRHYGYFYDVKTAFKWGAEWVKKNMPRQLKNFRASEPWRLSMTAGGMAKMALNGATFDKKRQDWMKSKIQEVIDAGKSNIKSKKNQTEPTQKRKSVADLVKEKTEAFIAETEVVLDDWENAPDDYSLYDELMKIDAAYVTAKNVADYYIPVRDEMKVVVSKKDKELLEGYEYMPLRKRRNYLKFLDAIVTDAEKYMASKKAVRKTRTKKTPSVGAQISKVKYLKESKEHKIASVDPTKIVGASEVWLFNTKYRSLSRIISSARAGFTIKGTTIQNIDEDKSDKKKLRKPDAFFGETSKATKSKINKAYNALTTKGAGTTGRINADTVIYKVY